METTCRHSECEEPTWLGYYVCEDHFWQVTNRSRFENPEEMWAWLIDSD